MTTEVFNIVVREDGSRVVRRNLDGIGDSARRSASSLDLLKRALAGIGIGLAIRKFVELIDTTTTINNRLKLVTNTTEEVNAVYGELLRISNATRTGLKTNADLFNRLALSARDLGYSYRDLLTVTENVNRAVVISGATATEANAALIQLSQGIASGTLRGDELRSVLEQLPKVADVIAEKLGVTRGELRELGQAGKIGAKDVIDAFLEAGDKLGEEFAKITPTIESAFTVFNNALLDFTRNLNASSGIGEILANTILFLADNFNAVAGAAAGLAVVIGGVLVGAIAKMTVALAANPLGLLVVAIAAATTAIGFFGDKTVQVGGQTATVWQVVKATVATAIDVFYAVRDASAEAVTGMVDNVSTFFSSTVDWLRDFASNWGISFDGVGELLKNAVNIWIGLHVGFIKTVGSVVTKGIPAQFKLAMALTKNIVLDALEFIIDKLVSGLGKIGDGLSYIPGVADDLGDKIRSALSVDFSGFKSNTEELAATAAKVGSEIRTEFTEALNKDYVGEFTTAVSDLGTTLKNDFNTNLVEVIKNQEKSVDINEILSRSYKNSTGAVNALSDAKKKLSEQQKIENQLLADSVKEREKFINTIIVMKRLLADPTSGFTKTDAFNAAGDLLGGDVFAGSQEALNAQIEQHRYMYEQIDALRAADIISEQTALQAKAKLNAELSEKRLANERTFFGELSKLSSSGNREIAAIGKAAAVTQATIDGYLAIQKALASAPPPWNYALAAAVGAATAANVASILSTPANFATGGSFVVPGSGPVDSQMVALRASPGERVTVQTPTQVRKGTVAANGNMQESKGPEINQRFINVVDMSMVGEYMETPEGEEVVINIIQRSGILRGGG